MWLVQPFVAFLQTTTQLDAGALTMVLWFLALAFHEMLVRES